MVLNYGIKDHIHTFHITGTKKELETIVQKAIDLKGDFAEKPIINDVHRGQYILYLKLNVGLIGVGANGSGENEHANESNTG